MAEQAQNNTANQAATPKKAAAKSAKAPAAKPAAKAEKTAAKAAVATQKAVPASKDSEVGNTLDSLRANLKTLTQDNAAALAELKQRSVEIQKSIAEHQKNLQRTVKTFLGEVVHEFGLTVEDVQALVRGGNKGTKAKAAVKFCNPANPSEVWTGRGRPPLWALDRVARKEKVVIQPTSPEYADDAAKTVARLMAMK
ncbi:DNA-binding protein H-NS [Chitinivorax tropicus]|uniref:DNA-binding protein H-NS n=1 Tax=Chitinivorax tropicus TaxID=714531 RepID=A0A840MHN3_9PROT|nr:H-NS histone family protein [Chitinivorax tropicus]MBB5018714.1 DNA-binding protein H-NS [Chitinivorax tropicus]